MCVSVSLFYLFGKRVSCAKTDEPIDMPFEGLSCVIPGNHVLDWGQGTTNLFATARGDKTAMAAFCKINLDTCLFV